MHINNILLEKSWELEDCFEMLIKGGRLSPSREMDKIIR